MMRMVRASVAASAATFLAAPSARAGGVTKGPWVQHVTTTSAVVRMEVDPPGPVTLEVQGPALPGRDGGATRTLAAGDRSAFHAIVVDGLAPATRYTYTVRAAGDSKVATFTTAPDGNVPFHFLVYGDSRGGDAIHASLVRTMTPVKTDFVVNTGDLVETGEVPRDWQAFFDIEAPLLRERCLFSAVGNHELEDGPGTTFIRYFGPNEQESVTGPEQLLGTFRWSSARFFVLNGMVRYRSGPARAWLERVLRDADDEKGLVWRIVVVHDGPWSSGAQHGGNRELLAAGIPELFKQHKVDLVLSGHDHIYERGWADGIGYLVSGGAGAVLYRLGKPRPTTRKAESVHHFIDASVTDVAIGVTATRIDGTTIERCALGRAAGWDCDGDRAPPAPTPPGDSAAAATTTAQPGSPAEPAPGPAPASASASRCACRAAGSRGAGATPWLALAALAGLAALLAVRRAQRSALRV
jgi:hypothetical protein